MRPAAVSELDFTPSARSRSAPRGIEYFAPRHEATFSSFNALGDALGEDLPPVVVAEPDFPTGSGAAEKLDAPKETACPSSTEVAGTTDFNRAALAQGRRTAYGIMAEMRVRPDEKTWDGTRITESLSLGSSTCPETLTRGAPCSGGSTFTVGGPSGKSAMLDEPKPGARNRFWDFHTTHVRPASVSVLHDSERNPKGLDTCTTVCDQAYSCGGNVIGKHKITRVFSKSTFKGDAVTLVTVTKT
jgi:hypothetical protein